MAGKECANKENILQQKCLTIGEQYEEKYLVVKEISDVGFANLIKANSLKKCYLDKFKTETEEENLFSEENISYFLKQLNFNHKKSLVDMKIGGCEMINPPEKSKKSFLCDSRCISLSRVLFTTDHYYGIYLSYSVEESLHIIKNRDGNFEPYKSIVLGIY